MDDSITVGRIFGIRLAVSLSWFFIFFLVIFTLGSVYFPGRYPDWPLALHWVAAVAASLLLFLCVLIHEIAHSLVALRKKVPVRSITLFMLGGVSHIGKDAPTPGAELLISLAGPLASLVLGVLAGGLFLLLGLQNEPVGALLFWLAGVNVMLGLFNLLPGFPLDGGRVLRALVWFAADDLRWATGVAARSGQLAAVTLALSGGYLVLAQEAGGLANGLWLIFIGWFLFTSAGASYQAAMVLDSLGGLTIGDVMRRDPLLVEEDTALSELAEILSANPSGDPFVVVRDGRPVGLAGHNTLKRTAPDRLGHARVGEVMQALSPGQVLTDKITAGQALQTLIEARRAYLPVVREGEVVGLVRADDLLRLVELRRRLKR
jgi:Zn-dependent protease